MFPLAFHEFVALESGSLLTSHWEAFYHINDVHAHLDEFKSSGTDCTNATLGCYGGYARVKTVIEETRPGHNDSLFLNVGDEFQVHPSLLPVIYVY